MNIVIHKTLLCPLCMSGMNLALIANLHFLAFKITANLFNKFSSTPVISEANLGCLKNLLAVGLGISTSTQTYIIVHYNLSVRNIDLVSHTTNFVCVNFIHKWRELQFKVDSERQIYLKNFSWQLYLLLEFSPEIC